MKSCKIIKGSDHPNIQSQEENGIGRFTLSSLNNNSKGLYHLIEVK